MIFHTNDEMRTNVINDKHRRSLKTYREQYAQNIRLKKPKAVLKFTGEGLMEFEDKDEYERYGTEDKVEDKVLKEVRAIKNIVIWVIVVVALVLILRWVGKDIENYQERITQTKIENTAALERAFKKFKTGADLTPQEKAAYARFHGLDYGKEADRKKVEKLIEKRKAELNVNVKIESTGGIDKEKLRQLEEQIISRGLR